MGGLNFAVPRPNGPIRRGRIGPRQSPHLSDLSIDASGLLICLLAEAWIECQSGKQLGYLQPPCGFLEAATRWSRTLAFRGRPMPRPLPLGSLLALILLFAACLEGCASRSQQQTSGAASQTGAVDRQPKLLTIALSREPQLILTGTSTRIAFPLWNAVHQRLAAYDNLGNPFPQLAVELPTRSNGTWLIRPDGTMQTTYRIRQNITWHDGTALTARDFLFGWTVCNDPELPVESRAAAQEISRIETPDDFTLVIEWKSLYASANAIYQDDLGPMPLHLLKTLYETDKEQFWRSGYWNREFVGVGPYRLADWQLGSQAVLEAYEGFYAGRAKIDRIVILFIPSGDSVVASMLAGAVAWVPSGDLKFEQATHIKKEWEASGQTPIAILDTGGLRFVGIQFRNPAYRELLDARFRRGLLHALDRQAISDGMFEGLAPIADTFIPPTDGRSEWFKDDLTRYLFDPRRAQDLLGEVGLRRGSDGAFVNATGGRMVLPQWVTPGTQNVQEVAIVADQWKNFGVPTEQLVIGPSQTNDLRFRTTFPALFHNSWSRFNVENIAGRFLSSQCVSEQSNWTGLNEGCYVNPAAEDMVTRLKAAFEADEQRPIYQELMKLYTDDLPTLPLYFQANYILVRQGITGVKGKAIPEGDATWNIGDWDIT
jgi:peptide/nickel transport system substrate-binding protein